MVARGIVYIWGLRLLQNKDSYADGYLSNESITILTDRKALKFIWVNPFNRQ